MKARQLDKPNSPHLVGEKVTGSVLVTTQKQGVKAKKITLDITGESRVSFKHNIRKRNKGKNEH